MKAKIIGISENFKHFSLAQIVDISINFLGEDSKNLHEVMIDGVKHIFEINKTYFFESKVVIVEGFITDNKNVGKISFEISLTNS